MRRSRIAPLVPLLAAVGPLTAHAAHAANTGDYVSPGVLFSFVPGQRANFGLGGEVSFNRINYDTAAGFGGFFNGVYYFHDDYGRLALGGQANYTLVGAEAGWAYTTPTGSTPELGGSTGPMAGGFVSFAVLLFAFRGTFAAFGDTRSGSFSIDLGLKVPLLVGGRQPQFGSGRPHRIDGAVVVDDPVALAECSVDPALAKGLGAPERDALGRKWLDDARLEHSAVSAFLTLAAELRALGAPASLVLLARSAAQDEARHTRICLEMARSYTGLEWTMPPFRRAEAPRRSVRKLVRESWEDGCLGEGLAARTAASGLRAVDPRTRQALEAIARDESRHAELAWSILEWCASERGSMSDLARVTLEENPHGSDGPQFSASGNLPTRTLNDHGRLSSSMLANIAERSIESAKRRARRLLAQRDG